MSVVQVEVTREELKTGVPLDGCGDPIVLAVKRHLRPECHANVGWGKVFIAVVAEEIRCEVELPPEAVEFYHAFDDGEHVEPIAFPLDIPAKFLRDQP